MTHRPRYNIYIASCTADGGIYRYTLSQDGDLTPIDFAPMDRPMYMTIANNKMYILLRAPFENGESGLIVYDLDKDCRLINPSEIRSTKGKVACHLMVDGDAVYCANYVSGSVIKMPDTLVHHHGQGMDPKRQEGPHAHFVGLAPDQRYVCVADLGLDAVYLYDKSLAYVDQIKIPTGHGARHLVFSDDGRYMFVANELWSTVSVFGYSDGEFRMIDTKSCLPQDFCGESTASAIRYHKGFVYVSNRGHDSIARMCFDGETLTLIDTFSCQAKTPRDFDFVGEHLICTGQDSDEITLFKVSVDGELRFMSSHDVKSPICVVYKETE